MDLLKEKKIIVKLTVGALFLVIALTIYWWHSEGGTLTKEEDLLISESDIPEIKDFNQVEESYEVTVDVSGAVKMPSVVTLGIGSRVYQAIESAGGLSDDAETRNINLAAVLEDGTKIYIPTKEQVKKNENAGNGISIGSSYNNGNENIAKDNLININIADNDELQRLAGIGPSTARKIMEYRKEYGGFSKIEELMNVSGIGEKTYKKIKDRISVE